MSVQFHHHPRKKQEIQDTKNIVIKLYLVHYQYNNTKIQNLLIS